MRFLVDLTCEGGALLFHSLIRRLEGRGHEVHITSRRYDRANQLQRNLNLDVVVLGSHGSSLYDKLTAYADRVRLLASHLKNLKIDAVVSNAGPAACRAGYGLALKVYTWNDMPEAEAQTRLTVPLSTWIFTPWIVPKEEFTRYGIPEEGVFQYRALYPMAWLPDVEVDPMIREKLGLDPHQPVIAFRESEGRAAYLLNKERIVLRAVQKLAEEIPEAQFVTRARYDSEELRSELDGSPNVKVFEEPIDLQSLLAKADLLVGGGATMNIEAAYYGTPVIACRAIEVRYERFLLDSGLAVKAYNVEEVVRHSGELLGERNDDLARKVFGEMNYPLEEIITVMEE